jgi:cell wall-associated NlpC family hydrolase
MPSSETRKRAEIEAAIVAEAITWLGTPYHNHGRMKGVGVDCAMLILETAIRAGAIIPFNPGAYPAQFGLHRDEEQFIGFVTRYATEIDAPQPGCVALFKYGRCYSHGGIMISDTRLVHAVMRDRAVIYSDLTDADLVDRAPRFFTLRAA